MARFSGKLAAARRGVGVGRGPVEKGAKRGKERRKSRRRVTRLARVEFVTFEKSDSKRKRWVANQ